MPSVLFYLAGKWWLLDIESILNLTNLRIILTSYIPQYKELFVNHVAHVTDHSCKALIMLVFSF